MDTELEERLNNKIKRADRIILFCMIGLLVVIVILFGGILYQNQRNADIARNQELQNHKRTQAYIRCVAETLTTSFTQRSTNVLDVCTDAADDRTKDADNK